MRKITRKPSWLCLLLFTAVAGAVEVNDTQTWGPTNLSGDTLTIGPGGNLTINGRTDIDNGTIILNGGTFTINGDFHFADDSLDPNPEVIYLYAGTMTVAYTESYRYRGAVVYVGAGEMTTGQVSNGNQYDPSHPTYWDIRPLEGYGPVQIEDVDGDRKRIWAPPLDAAVEFESASSEQLETVSPASVTVVVSRAEPGQTYTASYAVTGGTATGEGMDYELYAPCVCDFDGSGLVDIHDLAVITANWLSSAPGADVLASGSVNFGDYGMCVSEWQVPCGDTTLQFDPGQTIKVIEIEIVNDSLDELDETIEIELFDPTGPDLELGAIPRHTYKILDPRPRISFASATGSGHESVTSVNVEVNLSWAYAETVTVDYAVTGGTATGGGTDYTLPAGTLTFDPGVTTNNIGIEVVHDGIMEDHETILITMSNSSANALMGAKTEYVYTIADNEVGVVWDGLVWYYSAHTGGPFVNALGQLEWDPEGRWETGEQYITRIPEQRLSQTGDKVEITYWWLTDGKHDCPPDTCLICDRCAEDIRCIAGTGDMRAGLFESDGEYVEENGLGVFGSIFEGYVGYNFRFGPNMAPDTPTRWVDCRDEVHKTGNFGKKYASADNLMTYNVGLMDYIPGFGLAPGEWSLWTISLERLSSSTVRMSITLNGTTYTEIDDSGEDLPDKIDVFAIHMRNGRPYDRLVLANDPQ